MKQLIGFTKNGSRVTLVDFVMDPNSNETYAICLHQFGGLLKININTLTNVHYENV